MEQQKIEYNIPNLSMRLMHLWLSSNDRSFQYREEYTTMENMVLDKLVNTDIGIQLGQTIEFDYEWLASRNIASEPWSDAFVWFQNADRALTCNDFWHGTVYSSMRLLYHHGGCDVYRIGFGSKTYPDNFSFTDGGSGEYCNMHHNISKYHIRIRLLPGKAGANPGFEYTITEAGHPKPLSYTHIVMADQPELPNISLVFASNRVAYRISNLIIGNSHISNYTHFKNSIPTEDFVVFGNTDYKELHFHKEVEIIWVQTESIDCTVNNEHLHIPPDSVLLVNSNIYHRLKPHAEKAEITVLDFDAYKHMEQSGNAIGKYLYAFLTRNLTRPYCIYTGEKAQEMAQLMDNISREFQLKQPAYQLYLISCIIRITAILSRDGFLPDSNAIANNQNLNRILPAIQFINEHFSEKIGLSEISQVMTIDRHYLCRLFHSATNFTVTDYINFVRLTHAAEQLKNTGKSITEVAFQNGFSSLQYFNRLFKQYYGCTPMAYRKQLHWN